MSLTATEGVADGVEKHLMALGRSNDFMLGRGFWYRDNDNLLESETAAYAMYAKENLGKPITPATLEEIQQHIATETPAERLRFQKSDNGLVVEIHSDNPNDRPTIYTFDANGRLWQMQHPNRTLYAFSYRPDGRIDYMWRTRNGYGYLSHIEYDSEGLPLREDRRGFDREVLRENGGRASVSDMPAAFTALSEYRKQTPEGRRDSDINGRPYTLEFGEWLSVEQLVGNLSPSPDSSEQ